MSKKRAREVKATDTQLIEIYEDLANENEEIRLKAAHTLLTKFSDPAKTTLEQHKVIVGRLFRGLCSGRKAARLGFSIALTEFISQVFQPYLDNRVIGAVDIVDNLESQTAVEGGTSGQDERDHYFGRVFGAEAVIKSKILFSSACSPEAWKSLLGLVCVLAKKKPWLRQECGWILYSSIGNLSAKLASILIQELSTHELIRTPEGVAIWLEVRSLFPGAVSHTDVSEKSRSWKHGDPLHHKASSSLADIMKDAKLKQTDPESQAESQGTGMWSAQLHFAWDVVLRELYQESYPLTEGKDKTRRISFKSFWLQVVDESLFALSSSTERKQWGFLLLTKVLLDAPEHLLHHIFSPNAIKSLVNNLNGQDRYLQRSAQKAVQAIHSRVSREPSASVACLEGLLVDAGLVHFDKITKSKTIEKLLSLKDFNTQVRLQKVLHDVLLAPNIKDTEEAVSARKVVSDLLVRVFTEGLELEQKGKSPKPTISKAVMGTFVSIAYFQIANIAEAQVNPPIAEATRLYVRERMMSCLEQALRFGSLGRAVLRLTVAEILALRKGDQYKPVFQFDENVDAVVRAAIESLEQWPLGLFERQGSDQPNGEGHKSDHENSAPKGTRRKAKKGVAPGNGTYDNGETDGVVLLYHLTLLQVFNGEPEAVEILEDLNSTYSKASRGTEGLANSDALVEILLSFASKPSKFMRRISLQAFAAFAPRLSPEGLESLIRVLETKESLKGQDEMFDAEAAEESDNDDVEGLSDVSENSDVEMVDSDVEVLDGEASSDEHADAAVKINGEDGGSSSEDGDDDDELAAFDAKLAAALGTRKGEEDIGASDTSGSDEDMSDSEMEELDNKLAEVFRARKDLENKPKKKEHKDAKENIVNFKNRVLDLVDVYLKQEYINALSLQLVLPLLTLARKTHVKQLADRACAILREFNGRCKGTKLPQLVEGGPLDAAASLQILQGIHVEAGCEGSNAHASACSTASVLLVRILTHAGVDVADIVEIYGQTRIRVLKDKKCAIQPSFFTDWNNWCANARKSIAK